MLPVLGAICGANRITCNRGGSGKIEEEEEEEEDEDDEVDENGRRWRAMFVEEGNCCRIEDEEERKDEEKEEKERGAENCAGVVVRSRGPVGAVAVALLLRLIVHTARQHLIG